MSKSGCDYTLTSLESACGASYARGVVKAYVLPSEVATFTWGTGADDYNRISALILETGVQAFVITDLRSARFDGTQKEFADSTYAGQFTKTFSFNHHAIGLSAAQEVDALCNHPDGWVVILQRDKTHGHSAFEVWGAQAPAKITAVSANYGTDDELENTPTLTLECTEGVWGAFLDVAQTTDSDAVAYAANLSYVEALLTPQS